MTDESRSLAIEGARFFGEMSASVSHELKNVLAIINENAGLLQDMVAMNAKGLPLSAERLEGVSRSIGRQVARGDRIVTTMNRFAHSADHPIETVDVHELIGFVASLAGRLIAIQGNPPRIEVPENPVTVLTNRFYLENLVWACLRRAVAACEPGKEISIVAEKSDGCVRIRFRGLVTEMFAGGGNVPTVREEMVCQMVNARLTAEERGAESILVLDISPCGNAPDGDGHSRNRPM